MTRDSFPDEYMLAMSIECWPRDIWNEGEAEPTDELWQAAEEWWEQYRALNTSEQASPCDGLFDVLKSALKAQGIYDYDYDDGSTGYDFVHSDASEGWFIITSSPNFIEFVRDDQIEDLPDLTEIQGFAVNSHEGGGFSIKFAEEEDDGNRAVLHEDGSWTVDID